jgi:hypothetical protein
MSDITDREPHDEKTPEEVIAQIVGSWGMSPDRRPLPELIIEALVYKAYFEQAEGALRWLDQTDVLKRIGI